MKPERFIGMLSGALLLYVLSFGLVCGDCHGSPVERTIKTRSGIVYEKARIIKIDALRVTISHSEGTSSIALENLPANIQKEIGYVTDAQKEAKRQQADQRKKDQLAAMVNVKQRDADVFYNVTPEYLIARFGEPLSSNAAIDGADWWMAYEAEGREFRTVFVVPWATRRVIGGRFKGLVIMGRDYRR